MGKIIFISGASSGIGKALALAYADQGAVLGLTARREKLLGAVARECTDLGGTVQIYPLDVCDQNACQSAAESFLRTAGGIDIVLANAGVGGHDGIIDGDANVINNILRTNILGVTNTLVPFIPAMKEQRSGILVNVSSVASFLPIPFHGGYSGSKVCIRLIADAWRLTLSKYNIQVTTICPGFVDTPMIDNQRWLPFLLPVDIAAEKIMRAIARKKKTFVFPWQMRTLISFLRPIPDSLISRVVKY